MCDLCMMTYDCMEKLGNVWELCIAFSLGLYGMAFILHTETATQRSLLDHDKQKIEYELMQA